MPDCQNLSTCAFFKKYEQDETMKLALQGIIRKYCKGSMQHNCVRKKVSQALGAQNVPINMMPNGSPLTGTTSDDWSHDVKNVLSQKLSSQV
jgi:hypothetical protein